MGYCINCYAKFLKQRNPRYKKAQKKSVERYRKSHDMSYVNRYRLENARKWRKLAVEKLGGKCKKCSFSDYRALQIDHVNGDGSEERKIRKSINRKIVLNLTDVSRYQLLCANCNWIKRVENNE